MPETVELTEALPRIPCKRRAKRRAKNLDPKTRGTEWADRYGNGHEAEPTIRIKAQAQRRSELRELRMMATEPELPPEPDTPTHQSFSATFFSTELRDQRRLDKQRHVNENRGFTVARSASGFPARTTFGRWAG